MENPPNECINLNEVIFLPKKDMHQIPHSEPPSQDISSPRSARRISNNNKDKIHPPTTSQPSTGRRTNRGVGGHPSNIALASHYKDSPYLRDPFTLRNPDFASSRDRQYHLRPSPVEREEFPLPNPILAMRNNPLLMTTNSSANKSRRRSVNNNDDLMYQQRNKIYAINRQDFFNGLSQKYATRAAMTPYGMDMNVYRDQALKKSARNRWEENCEDKVETARINRMKKQAREYEMIHNNKFDKDYYFNSKYPSLRMVPVKDRIDRAGDESIVFI